MVGRAERPATGAERPPPRVRGRRIGWLDVVLLALVAAAAVWVIHRVDTRLTYTWNWSMIPGYVVFFDEATGTWRSNLLLDGLVTTLRMTVAAGIMALVIGALMAVARVSNVPSIRWLARTYVELVRNLPPLIFIFVFYFFISGPVINLLGVADWARELDGPARQVMAVLFGPPERFANFVTGTVCLALFEAAYVTEILRAGIQAVSQGQWEASQALGLSRWRTLRLIVVPQAVRKVVPPLTGQLISLVKDSSIVSLISVQELTFAGQQISVATRKVFEVWLTVAAFYFAICFTLSVVSRRLERHFGAARR
ncbi:MAG: amino acid ABC transporter permease [Pseudomonadota bacterium]